MARPNTIPDEVIIAGWNARKNPSKLAKEVGVSRQAIMQRYDKLLKKGIISISCRHTPVSTTEMLNGEITKDLQNTMAVITPQKFNGSQEYKGEVTIENRHGKMTRTITLDDIEDWLIKILSESKEYRKLKNQTAAMENEHIIELSKAKSERDDYKRKYEEILKKYNDLQTRRIMFINALDENSKD